MIEEAEVPATKLLGYDDPARAPESTAVEKLTLKQGDYFAVTTRIGDISPAGARDMGFFREDTRHLSFLRFGVSGGPPVVLSTATSTDYVTQIDMTVTRAAEGGILHGDPVNFIHIRREQVIDSQLSDRFVFTNYMTAPVDFWMELEFGADFADVFEIRGWKRARRGTYLAPLVRPDRVVYRYRGIDRRLYRTEVVFKEKPAEIEPGRALFRMKLQPNARCAVEARIVALYDAEPEPPMPPFAVQAERTRKTFRDWKASCTRFQSSHDLFDAALDQGAADLQALGSTRNGESVIAAGIPWYTCPFGRDTILTAFEALPLQPDLARSALLYLAAHQGTKIDPDRDEEPGKILHEVRTGEMARTGEIPYSAYYGTVDATPLFLVLLSEYFAFTGDRKTVVDLLPAAQKALRWIDEHGDMDGDGLVEYARHGPGGLVNQGWKDSRDGVIFADGAVARAPIALVEVQGYVRDARRRMSRLFRIFGKSQEAHTLLGQARRMERLIEERFWMAAKGTYAEALDGEKRQVDSITSNAGHLLFSGAVHAERARSVASVLMGPACFSGWGVRTLAAGQPAFNPLSYHNGTIWPHDNALCAMGFANYGLNHLAVEVLDALFAASASFRHNRLPELFCGLSRDEGEFPVHYPVACSPQAWASAAFFLLLRACLGLYPDAPRQTLRVQNPRLPRWLDELRIERMRIGKSLISLHFTRTGEGTFAAVTALEGDPLRVRIDVPAA